MERFLRAADALAGDGPPAPEVVLDLAARHGIEMLTSRSTPPTG